MRHVCFFSLSCVAGRSLLVPLLSCLKLDGQGLFCVHSVSQQSGNDALLAARARAVKLRGIVTMCQATGHRSLGVSHARVGPPAFGWRTVYVVTGRRQGGLNHGGSCSVKTSNFPGRFDMPVKMYFLPSGKERPHRRSEQPAARLLTRTMHHYSVFSRDCCWFAEAASPPGSCLLPETLIAPGRNSPSFSLIRCFCVRSVEGIRRVNFFLN